VKPSGARILLVEDERGIATAVRRNLGAHGFAVQVAETGAAALEQCSQQPPDLIILDLGLPDMDGTRVIEEVRATSSLPIIVLSVRGEERVKVRALDLGADDYLTKPFGVEELLARIRVALRHAAHPGAGTAPVFQTGALEVDVEQHQVTVDGHVAHLTPTEYELLNTFIGHPDKLLTDRMLLQAVWGPEYGDEAHYLHVYIARLRKKIEPDPQRPRYIVTEPGVGYRLVTQGA
jgi:two-component system KDP operon response regulator KdpE